MTNKLRTSVLMVFAGLYWYSSSAAWPKGLDRADQSGRALMRTDLPLLASWTPRRSRRGHRFARHRVRRSRATRRLGRLSARACFLQAPRIAPSRPLDPIVRLQSRSSSGAVNWRDGQPVVLRNPPPGHALTPSSFIATLSHAPHADFYPRLRLARRISHSPPLVFTVA